MKVILLKSQFTTLKNCKKHCEISCVFVAHGKLTKEEPSNSLRSFPNFPKKVS